MNVAFVSAIATSIDVPSWVALAGAVLGSVSLAAAAIAVARQSAIKASLATIVEANAELRQANHDLKLELADEREKRAVLEGRLDAVTNHIADQIVAAVAAALARAANQRPGGPS